MNAEFAKGGALELAIGRMIFDGLRIAAELVALMQYGRMPVGEPRAFVEMTACERAEAIEMRLDVTEQRVRQIYPQEISQRRVGAVEIHARRVGREQVRLRR